MQELVVVFLRIKCCVSLLSNMLGDGDLNDSLFEDVLSIYQSALTPIELMGVKMLDIVRVLF